MLSIREERRNGVDPRSDAVKITIESTNEITYVDGIRCRVWTGTTERGIACFVFAIRLAVRSDLDTTEFERELLEMDPPTQPIIVSEQLVPKGVIQ